MVRAKGRAVNLGASIVLGGDGLDSAVLSSFSSVWERGKGVKKEKTAATLGPAVYWMVQSRTIQGDLAVTLMAPALERGYFVKTLVKVAKTRLAQQVSEE